MTTAERLEKYPTSHYDPKPDCYKCHGAGEFLVPRLNRMTCCICIFVDHEYCESIGKDIGQFAKRELAKLRS